MIKKLGKNFLCSILERQVIRLRTRNEFTIIAVGGSVGKTSTKLAIAKLLASKAKVQFQNGNYNDRLTVPLVIFGEVEPSIFNILAWAGLLLRTARASRNTYDYQYVVLELGTDGPGQMKDFAYLKPEVYVLTAIAMEHMEYFKTLEAIAAEELAPVAYAKNVLINVDDVAEDYLPESAYTSYGIKPGTDYQMAVINEQQLIVQHNDDPAIELETKLLGAQGAKAITAAVAIAAELGWQAEDIKQGIAAIEPVAGRMQQLRGHDGSTIIDDTYNASPIAVKAALDVLYDQPSKHRIAILGTMNELGEESQEAHTEVGAYCQASKLDLVVTIGKQAEDYLAPAAKAAGCEVVSFVSPYEAGKYVCEKLTLGTVVLAKGSQNGVFAEETVKLLLADSSDASKLVRQSAHWLAIKRKQFPDAS